jgi:hypothetical protein
MIVTRINITLVRQATYNSIAVFSKSPRVQLPRVPISPIQGRRLTD